MTNAELFANLTRRNIARMETHMGRGLSYAEALAKCRTESVGGPMVWQAVEQHFATLKEQQS